MPYAVVQHELEPPPTVEQMVTALAEVEHLTAYDAFNIIRDAFGVLVEKLHRDEATRIAQSLTRQGVPCGVVDEAELFPMPAAYRSREVLIESDRLGILNTVDQPRWVAWDEVLFIAVGDVAREVLKPSPIASRVHDMPTTHRSFTSRRMAPIDFTALQSLFTSPQRVKQTQRTLEIFTLSEPMRTRLEPLGTRYTTLGPRLTDRVEANFLLLCDRLIAHATAAGLNRGAVGVQLGDPLRIPVYPSPKSFEEETTWHIWRRAQPGSSS